MRQRFAARPLCREPCVSMGALCRAIGESILIHRPFAYARARMRRLSAKTGVLDLVHNYGVAKAERRAVRGMQGESGEIKYTTCYMCACRCGIKVHLEDGRVRYIEGNPRHPVNRGVLCAKGAAGIMQHYSPARLQKPLKRVGPRGSGEFV